MEGANWLLHLSGQTAIVADPDAEMGLAVKYENDQGKQMQFALDSIDSLLKQAGMSRKNIINLKFFTTDMRGFFANYQVYKNWIRDAGIKPTQSAIGVKELVLPALTIEIEVLAAG